MRPPLPQLGDSGAVTRRCLTQMAWLIPCADSRRVVDLFFVLDLSKAVCCVAHQKFRGAWGAQAVGAGPRPVRADAPPAALQADPLGQPLGLCCSKVCRAGLLPPPPLAEMLLLPTPCWSGGCALRPRLLGSSRWRQAATDWQVWPRGRGLRSLPSPSQLCCTPEQQLTCSAQMGLLRLLSLVIWHRLDVVRESGPMRVSVPGRAGVHPSRQVGWVPLICQPPGERRLPRGSAPVVGLAAPGPPTAPPVAPAAAGRRAAIELVAPPLLRLENMSFRFHSAQ